MTNSPQLSDPAIFERGTESNHQALEALAELLNDIGVSARKKSRNEHTLRVYPKKQNQYPLLNPRFIDGLLSVTISSKGEDTSLDSTLASAQDIPGCTFKPLNATSSGYRYHGVLTFALDHQAGLSALSPQLKAVHGLLARHT
ncbi:MAG: hypothetical protein O3A00_21635 [Planctomycetota bacterium]|nr:hypothetical protein [Planctomycetota bacterium]